MLEEAIHIRLLNPPPPSTGMGGLELIGMLDGCPEGREAEMTRHFW